ncbi:MAG TPA: AMP-binding protein [Candidatus Acidoferrales bacterium]|nr:AMP-binding protein [Candidatus Acidoferrales bacterium]
MRSIDYFDKAADTYPHRIAIFDRGTRYSYRELRRSTEKIARAMQGAGLRPEDRAAILSFNDGRVLLCMLGMMRAGAAWVPLNYRNAVDASAEYMNYVEARWLFYHSSFSGQADELKSRVPSLHHLVCIDAEDRGFPSLDAFMEQGGDKPATDSGDPFGNLDGLVGLVPTGGTTGPAKGVRVTNLAWGTMLDMASHYWQSDESEAVCLSAAPLSHAAGVVAIATLGFGATNIVMPSPNFEPLEVLRAIERHKVTHLYLPPTALYKLLALPEVGQFDYSSLRILLLAGSPVSPDQFKKGVKVFGPCLCQCYGQTEAPMLLTWLEPKAVAAAAAGIHPERLRSCGKATSAVRLAVMNGDGRLLPPGETGEIVARGSLVTPGYYNLPDATEEIHRHGWHHTGDVGYCDEDGYFYIVDRKKDMIITGGFNVFSAEVEAGIMALPDVADCAVIGVPDDKWGEAVKAIVVLRKGASLGEQDVIAHCKAKLGSMKAPKSVEFRAEIPKTAAGKTDRKLLRAPYWAGADRAVH